MISKEVQYRIYAGTSKDDYTGWIKTDSPDGSPAVEFWSLDLGSGFFLDRVTKEVKGILGKKTIRVNSIRRDMTVQDPDGEYKDLNFSMLFNVKIMVSPDAIKFDSGNNTFVLLSREPADWDDFSENVPKFEDKDIEQNWASFYS